MVHRRDVEVGRDRKAGAVNAELPTCAVERQPEARTLAASRFAHDKRSRERPAVEESVLRVGSFAAILERIPAADGGDRLQPTEAKHPVDNVEMVGTEVSHLPAGGVPEPAEVVQPAKRVVLAGRCRSEPHLPVEVGGWWGVRRIAEAREDVPHRHHPYRRDGAYVPTADKITCLFVVRPGALLRTDLYHPLGARGHGLHPLALADEPRQRLLDVDVL